MVASATPEPTAREALASLLSIRPYSDDYTNRVYVDRFRDEVRRELRAEIAAEIEVAGGRFHRVVRQVYTDLAAQVRYGSHAAMSATHSGGAR